ncbi:McrC family protein [Clostridioides sp. ES-S-0005-03]|uniref:McrC family protein n=1 Tax=Clostridioides sp. ES-S-0005-03 TaxID=2770774 RepID=UPI001D129B7D|nr:McrC family protein [Clostridioides sp. ES-S-0005-03]UDN47610.1 McrC family protein [Clostridioides sp. ES-S-0173-01]
MSKNIYAIKEYGFFVKESKNIDIGKLEQEGNVVVPNDIFEYIESFILENQNEFDVENHDLMQISYKKGIGKIIKAKNYVGTIQTPKGVTIEILPKIYISSHEDSYKKTKKIFLKMLKSVKDMPFKTFNMANLDTINMEILDIFIIMFLDEVSVLIKKGIKSSYIKEEGNLNYLRGKLLINKHISKNIISKDKFYLEYDEYSKNIPENRIIKSTLLKLKDVTSKSNIQNRIQKYYFAFDEVDKSLNYEKDFSRCTNNRLMNDYKLALEWSKIFLQNKGFTSYKGGSKSYSLLFPMEKVFENYVANSIKKCNLFNKFDVIIQARKDETMYLFDTPKKFKLKPDIIMKNSEETIILDTKWKNLYDNYNKNYGISQSDMYQMYAYSKKYNANKIIIIYPYNYEAKKILSCGDYSILFFKSYDGVNVQIYFFDIEKTEDSLYELHKIISD